MEPVKNDLDQEKISNNARIVYFSHGGGPLPLLGDAGHKAMVAFMKRLPEMIAAPDAILVISAHWEERSATVLDAPNPPLFYDYYGFPDEAYKITYPVPGSPELARRIADAMDRSHIPVKTDSARGFDHGLFIPLKLMYPEAAIPAVQLSLLRGLDPKKHIALGKALREFAAENILVIGSGFSFHNMGAFVWDETAPPDQANDDFQNWLIGTCTGPLNQSEREKRLQEWEHAPSARYCHPREEHLLPLHVCLGMANAQATLVFDDYILGKRGVAFLW